MTGELDHHLTEITDHRLSGREVAHLATGRKGVVSLILEHRAKISGRLIRTVAHMRPLDSSGREWTAEVEELQPIRPIPPDMPAGYR
ncbi:hypothetical protein ACFWP3_06090 [Streptomyces sp. NPDC058525]|uniref:hypothetical protein n=1 Tax=unclassified Streptomyces TaxID=2593676 RepID=UPI00364653E3